MTEEDQVGMNLKLICIIAIIVFAIWAGFAGSKRYKIAKFEKEWHAYAANVEAMLPDRVSEKYPEIAQFDIRSMPELITHKYDGGWYYLFNVDINVHLVMDASCSSMSAIQRCYELDHIQQDIVHMGDSIKEEYTPEYAEECAGSSISIANDYYGNESTERSLTAEFNDGKRYKASLDRFGYIYGILEETTNQYYSREETFSGGVFRSEYVLDRNGTSYSGYSGSSSSGNVNTGSDKTVNSSSGGSGKTSSGSGKKHTFSDSYSEGYDNIYMDEDYDEERYERDPDYASGVDDAMDDDGDW
ncbi:MAG: hypothetical protein Q4E57_08765 [Eubacteriales bacterium]|nr:hypothetical protein [Eubacteriales bacterium]